MKTRMLSAVLAAFMLATASVGGITASAAEKATAAEDTAETTVVDEDSSADTTETTADTAESSDTEETSSVSDESDDMEKFREVMSELAENGTTEVTPDYYGDDYYDTDGNATLIKSERIVYNSEEMQFIAVTTKDGHVFYVLINYSAENAEDQVFFLNKVDDYDLYALLYAGSENDDEKKITPEQAAQAAEKANGRVQSGDGADTADTAETAEDGEDATDSAAQAKPVPMSKNSMMLVLGAIALIGVGGAGFFIMKKKNGGSSKSAMQIEPEYDDDNEITEDEDDMKFYDDQDDED